MILILLSSVNTRLANTTIWTRCRLRTFYSLGEPRDSWTSLRRSVSERSRGRWELRRRSRKRHGSSMQTWLRYWSNKECLDFFLAHIEHTVIGINYTVWLEKTSSILKVRTICLSCSFLLLIGADTLVEIQLWEILILTVNQIIIVIA